jgi:hypothetical protein
LDSTSLAQDDCRQFQPGGGQLHLQPNPIRRPFGNGRRQFGVLQLREALLEFPNELALFLCGGKCFGRRSISRPACQQDGNHRGSKVARVIHHGLTAESD